MSILLLLISIAALSVGPLIVRAFAARPGVTKALDGFVTIGIGGLVLFHVIPPSVAVGGYVALVFMIVGMIIPTAIERVQHGNIRAAHTAALALAFIALALHALVDGVALSQAESGASQAVPVAIAVVLHRIPEGLAVWMLLRASQGLKWTIAVMGFIAATTLIGFLAGPSVVALMQGASFGWFQAFVAGSLLHVIFHAHEHDHAHDHGDPHGHGHSHDHSAPRQPSALAPLSVPQRSFLSALEGADHTVKNASDEDASGSHGVRWAKERFQPELAAKAFRGGEASKDAGRKNTSTTTYPQAFPTDAWRFVRSPQRVVIEECCVTEVWDAPDASAWERFKAFVDLRSVRRQLPEVLGALAGIGMVWLVSWVEGVGHGHGDPHDSAHHGDHHNHVHEHAHTSLTHGMETSAAALPLEHVDLFSAEALERLLHLALDSAPMLLAGYLLSVILFRFVATPSLLWLNGGSRWSSAVRGAFFGAPMPVRACGVVPVFESLMDRGARLQGSTSFLLATPQLRLETILFSLPLLGLPLMGLRVAGVLAVSIGIGWLVSSVDQESVALHVDPTMPPRLSLASALRQCLLRLVDDTAPWVLFGLVIAVLVAPDSLSMLQDWPFGLELLFFGLLGIPVYLCATGATPVAAALIFAGASPGAALVFLLAGPVAMVGAFRAIQSRRGPGVAYFVIGGFWLGLLGIGAWTNLVFAERSTAVLGLHDHTAGNVPQWLALGAIGALFGWSLLRRGPRAWLNTIVAGDHG